MTTPVQTPKLLKEYLDHLDEKMLKEFQWYLVRIKINGSRPIPKSKLPENSTREATVDKLLEAFGEDDAVERTVDTFFQMKCDGLALQLIQAKVDQSKEQKEDDPETSSAREKPREVDPTVTKDLSCSICLSLFTDPVMLQCGHSFCWSCVHEDWEKNIIRECSLCKQFIPEGDPPINFSLKSLCENYRGRSQGEPSGGHGNNTESFQSPPENNREKQEALKRAKQLCDSSIELIKTQSCNTENKITDVFKKLHDSLDEEEKTRRDALRKEASLKIRMIHLMHEKIKNALSLSDTLTSIAKLGADKILMENSTTEVKRMQMTMRNLQKISQAERHFSKHVENLQLDVLKKMLNDIKPTGADDGNEDEHLSVFSDIVHTMNDKRQLFPRNPERNTRNQQNQQKSLKRRRVGQDHKNGKVSFHDPDNDTSILKHEWTFTQSPFIHFLADINTALLPSLPIDLPADIMDSPPLEDIDEVQLETVEDVQGL